MDGIVPFRDHPNATPRPVRGRQAASAPTAIAHHQPVSGHNLAAVKTPFDYLRAMKRRLWLILAVAVPLALLAAVWALRQPKIYQARTEIAIEAPAFDPVLSTLVSHEIGRHDQVTQEKYIPNHVAMLQSVRIADKVVRDPRIAPEIATVDDAAQELILSKLQVRQVGKTNLYNVTLEGRDPSLTKRLLESLLEAFSKASRDENLNKIEVTRTYAQQRLKELNDELGKVDKEIYSQLQQVKTIGPGGKNLHEERYLNLGQSLAQKQSRLGELHQQMMIAQAFPRQFGDGDPTRQQRAALEAEKKKYVAILSHQQKVIRKEKFNSDPAVIEYSHRLNDILDELQALDAPLKTDMAMSPTQMILDQYRTEVEHDQEQLAASLAQLQESMPEHERYMARIEHRDHVRRQIDEMEKNINSFRLMASAQEQNEPVKYDAGSVIEPTAPIRPNRALYIVAGIIVSLAAGMALVVVLEHLDHTVKIPEHVAHGLVLPLLGVVPRIRRTSQSHRGGHLWTASTPDSLEADAFRNIRASLLGVADRRGPIVTLLMTSPKAGDGKSTAALNLAATCARAGERTLLLDVDLRRPTLADVFPAEPDKEGTLHGLVDVLRGDLPWQKTLRHTELRNLDFIPTGDTTDIPIEILGTLELRQLLTALSKHYDRVILDGPAMLGMADCRMLGRMVDSSVLVVRAGSHQLLTLQRAKTMLEQSHVPIAGVVVNSLCEGVQHWSSYGYAGGGSTSLPVKTARGLAAEYQEARDGGAMVLAGSNT